MALTKFGKAVRELRLERGMRLGELADRLNLSSAFLSAVETGRKPVPHGFAERVADALDATAKARTMLEEAAEASRARPRVAELSPTGREAVAEFARQLQGKTDDEARVYADKLRTLLAKLRKDGSHSSADGELPFRRGRRGLLVPGCSRDEIWASALKFRQLTETDDACFDVIAALEFHLPYLSPGFYFDVVERSVIDGDEGRTVPAEQAIYLRRDVYDKACKGEGRARFTVAHEIAHYVLHRGVTLARRSDDYPIFRDAEWQADTFAGGLLMPAHIVQRCEGAGNLAEKCGVTYAAAEVQYGYLKRSGNRSIYEKGRAMGGTMIRPDSRVR